MVIHSRRIGMSSTPLSTQSDALHRMWLARVLTNIAEDTTLAQALAFKGGTCATMLGYLDRFSVDLDFDLIPSATTHAEVRYMLERIFSDLGLIVRDMSRSVPQYFLKYPAREGERNTLKVDVTKDPPKANRYEAKRLVEIDRILTCQTLDTMVANKLVALTDRHKKRETIAGRDVYDIHHFLTHGYPYAHAVIEERTGVRVDEYLASLHEFIARNVTEELLSQDLNALLPLREFSRIRKSLKQETLAALSREIDRTKAVEA